MSADSDSDVSGPVAMISGNIDGSVGMRGDFLAHDGDQRMRRDRVGDRLREALAIDGQRRARRHAVRVGRAHDQRAEPPHLLLQEADGVIELVAAERVGADELGEPIGLVDRGRPHRPHLVEHHAHAERRRLPGGFGAGEPAADDVDHGIAKASGSGP